MGEDLYVKAPGILLSQTLDCGQCFRWQQTEENVFHGVAMGMPLTIIQDGQTLIFKDTTADTFDNIWREYFDLDTDYDKIKSVICRDDIINRACAYAGGIKILKQDPWEAICTFIISQNNNIPRIKGIVARLCENFGEKLSNGEFSFPTAKCISLLSLDDLMPLRAGFRAKYILDAAQKIAGGSVNISEIRERPVEEARESLMTICGIGPKVAECALLFGFYRVEAFPIDVWIKRALDYYYKDGFPAFAVPYGGIAQQYIFHYIRTCEDAIPDEYKKK